MPNVPAFLLRLVFGKMAVILTNGSRVSAQKIKEAGFVFEFESLEEALRDLLKK
jgi:NAD dependent epimerase/dehydratase family enzyme